LIANPLLNSDDVRKERSLHKPRMTCRWVSEFSEGKKSALPLTVRWSCFP